MHVHSSDSDGLPVYTLAHIDLPPPPPLPGQLQLLVLVSSRGLFHCRVLYYQLLLEVPTVANCPNPVLPSPFSLRHSLLSIPPTP